MNHLYGLGQVSKLTGVLRHRIVYALQNGYLPEPHAWISNQRAWSAEEVTHLAQYFGSKVDWPAADKSRADESCKNFEFERKTDIEG